mmetsp:Transcript_36370/g.81792  ORF Transcript_36370/g.81792 Transcript_36370/m.81792 type:complete len:249 (+) Transcript_36370:113-859(+)
MRLCSTLSSSAFQSSPLATLAISSLVSCLPFPSSSVSFCIAFSCFNSFFLRLLAFLTASSSVMDVGLTFSIRESASSDASAGAVGRGMANVVPLTRLISLSASANSMSSSNVGFSKSSSSSSMSRSTNPSSIEKPTIDPWLRPLSIDASTPGGNSISSSSSYTPTDGSPGSTANWSSSDTPSFSLSSFFFTADFNWPQPASMSIPRLIRGVALIPNSFCNTSTNRSTLFLPDGLPTYPPVGLRGIRLT